MRPLSRRAVLAGFGVSMLWPWRLPAAAAGRVPILDTHVHFPRAQTDEPAAFDGAAALAEMDRFGIEKAILSPPPHVRSARHLRIAQLSGAVRGNPRFAFAAGGESLNPILQATPATGVSAEVLRQFTALAANIAAAGAASFGELAAEHFSSGRGRHPYESSPPDHPLLLALADMAARYGMPIDLHMEAVPADMPLPPERARGANPDHIPANIARFERLLEHNPRARIVWLHAGWDLTGERSVALMRGLLERHANLSMSIKYDHAGARETAPFPPQGGDLRPGWMAMLHDYPDRFMIGSDQFFGDDSERLAGARGLVDALPAELARRIAGDNARHVYRLDARV